MKTNDFLKSLQKHWKGVWLTISVVFLVLSVMMGRGDNIVAWAMSSILAGITFSNSWRQVFQHLGKIFVGLASGKWGKDTSFLVLTVVLFALGMLSASQRGPTHDAEMLIGLSMISFIISAMWFVKMRMMK